MVIRRNRPPVDPEEAHGRFEAEFEKLQFESGRLAAIERSPENFQELAAGHQRVTELQNRATDAKRDIHTRYEGKNPDWVELHPGGPGDTSRAGKIGVLIGAAVLLVLGIGGSLFVYNNWRQSSVRAVDVVNERVEIETHESGDSCTWRFDVVVENPTDSAETIDRARVIFGRQFVNAELANDVVVEPGERAVVPLSRNLGRADGPEMGGACPAVDDLDHGRAALNWTGVNASIEF